MHTLRDNRISHGIGCAGLIAGVLLHSGCPPGEVVNQASRQAVEAVRNELRESTQQQINALREELAAQLREMRVKLGHDTFRQAERLATEAAGEQLEAQLQLLSEKQNRAVEQEL